MTAGLERVRVSETMSGSSAFAAKVQRQGARRLAARLEQVGLDAVRRCDAIVQAELVNDRIPSRRRGGRHLRGSFRHEVEWDGVGFPVSIRLYSLADPAKVNAMESGADPHEIKPVNATFLSFPRGAMITSLGKSGDTKFSNGRGKGQIYQGYTGRGTVRGGRSAPMTRLKSVNHPGNLPHSMMERALKAAVQAALAGARVR